MLKRQKAPVQLVAALLVVLAGATQLHAQWYSRDNWNFNFGLGVTNPIGNTRSRLDTGWNYKVGAGYNFSPKSGLILEFARTGMDVSDRVLAALDVPDGNSRIYSLTLNPIYRVRPGERFGGYMIGGVGYYRRTVEFTQPTTAVTFIADPWWGYIGPVLVPVNQILGSVSSNAVGFNVGLGFTIGNPDARAKFYTEVRYHYADTRNRPTHMLPITFGLRW